jgi:hypothetical protein
MSRHVIDTGRSGIKFSGKAVTARAGIDTIELQTDRPKTPAGTPAFLAKLRSKYPSITTPPIDTVRRYQGGPILKLRIGINHVPFAALDEIDEWQRKHELTLARADVGVAIMGIDPHEWFKEIPFLLKQKRVRPNPWEGYYPETHVTADMKTADRFMRAYVAEGERAKSYLTGNDDPVSWVEAKLGPRALDRLDFKTVADLKTVNPKAIFDDMVKWAWKDWDRERKKLDRKIRPQCRDTRSWKAGDTRHRILSMFNRSRILSMSRTTLSRETFIGWMPETPFIENKGFF